MFYSRLHVIFFLIFYSLNNDFGTAQETLPKGVGLIQLGYRKIVDQEVYYNEFGDKLTLGSKLDKDFSGKNILQGAGGPLLKRLAEELRKLDIQDPTQSQTVVNQLNLGSLRGDIVGQVSARIVGIGYGITDYLTFFAGIPYVDARVTADMQLVGQNTAQQVLDYLRNAAYDELKDGLRKAAQLNINQIKQSILDNGYQDISSWEHSGWGDLRIGLRTGFSTYLARPVRFGLGLATTLEVPTGYKDDPDILTDVPTSKGYYALTFTGEPRLKFFNIVTLGLNGNYTKGFSTSVEKRVPEAEETITSADRKATVLISPGGNMGGAALVGVGVSVIGLEARAGFERKSRDTYTGSMTGNYRALADDSEKFENYYELGANVSTATLYQKKRFPVPFILAGTYHVATSGRNTNDNRYFEITFSTFFPTPFMEPPKKSEFKRKKKKRRKVDD